MNYLEVLATVYVTTNILYSTFALFRDLKNMDRSDGMKGMEISYSENIAVLIKNAKDNRTEIEMYKKAFNDLYSKNEKKVDRT